MKPMILVTLNLTQLDDKVLKYADFIGKRAGLPLKLLHAYEKPIGGPSLFVEPEIIEILEASKNRELEDAKTYLEKKAKQLKCEATVKVVVNNPARGIIEELKNETYKLILTGADDHVHSNFLKNLSCNLSLYNKATVPILTVNGDQTILGDDDIFRVLLTDDMSEHSKVSEFAQFLEKIVGKSHQMRVLHVSNFTEEDLKITLSLPGGFAHKSSEDSTLTLSKMDKAIKDQLKKKYQNASHGPDIHIRRGKVKEEIKEEIKSWKPHLVVFGKHKTLHTDPIYLGRIMFSTAFQFDTPFIVLP